jgi:hypothetical protein
MAQQITCPRCQAVLRVSDQHPSQMLTCPRCLSEIELPAAAGDAAPDRATSLRRMPDVQAKRDQTFTAVILLSLAVLCLVALAALVVQIITVPDDFGRIFLLMGIFAIADVVILFALGIWYFPWATQRLGSSFPSALITVGGFLLVAAAIVIFLFATCYGILVTSEPNP